MWPELRGRRVDGRACDARGRNDSGRSGYRQLRSATGALLQSGESHPLEIFLVILIAGSLAGVLGMLLAIPAYNVIRVFAKEFFNNFRVVQKLTEKI